MFDVVTVRDFQGRQYTLPLSLWRKGRSSVTFAHDSHASAFSANRGLRQNLNPSREIISWS